MAIALAASTTFAQAADTTFRLDVYTGVCSKVKRACMWDWGGGRCYEPRGNLDAEVHLNSGLFGDGGGSDGRHCTVVGPWFKTKRASVETRADATMTFTKGLRFLETDVKPGWWGSGD